MRFFTYALLTFMLIGCVSSPPEEGKHGKNSDQIPGLSGRSPQVDAKSQNCVALAMYWEARGEGRQGMLAVGSVVMNRVEDYRFPNSACDVVYQGGETPPCQFSWWCDGKSDRPTDSGIWAVSLELANALLESDVRDPTNGALFFHNRSIGSPWRRVKTAEIGNHIFYR